MSGTQYSPRLLSFFRNAQREITFGQPHQRRWRMRRRLIVVDHLAEAQSSGKPLGAAFIETADLHFLACQMVVHQVDLQTGIGRVTAFGIAADQFTQRTQRLFSRSEEHTSELKSLMRISYAVFCLKKTKKQRYTTTLKNTPTHQCT